MTRKQALEVIQKNKDNTAWFDKSLTREDMYNMLRYRMQFGQAETEVLLAALKLAGADFK